MNGTFEFEMAQQTNKISFIYGSKDTSPDFMRKVLTLLITCSTRTLTLMILLVFLTSDGVMWEVPLFPGGTTNSIFLAQNLSMMLNPMSAINIEKAGMVSKNLLVTAFSDILPV